MIRLTIHFSGRVQGVGFRYTTATIAKKHPVCGFVQNLPDGRVLLMVEGQPDEVQTFVDEVRDRMGPFIEDCLVDESAATGEFGSPAQGGLSVRY